MSDPRIKTVSRVLGIMLTVLSFRPVSAGDWPTWRHDASRSAATADALPAELSLKWSRQLPALKPAWPEDPRLHFDAVYQPVVAGKRMFIGSSANDSVTAFDTATGAELWRTYADGPVRFAPVAWQDKVYFGADDGCVYCVRADTGDVVWKFSGAPNARKAFGNERLVSVWPVRGGLVLENGTVYFTVGVWPFEGTFLYAVDAQTGKPVAATGDDDTNPIVLKDRTPQGYLAISDSRLFIPCGRAAAICLDRDTGKLQSYGYRTSAVTNYHVAVQDRWLFHGVVAFDTTSKATMPVQASEPVLTRVAMYFAAGGSVSAYNLSEPEKVVSKDRRGKETSKLVMKKLWSHTGQSLFGTAANDMRIHVKAGSRLYGQRGNLVFAIDLTDEQPRVSWQAKIDGTSAEMLVADDKLFVVTTEGAIVCFGSGAAVRREDPEREDPERPAAPVARQAAKLLAQANVKAGYCLVTEVRSGQLLEALADASQLRIVGICPDERDLLKIRRRLDARELYAARVCLLAGDIRKLSLPPYFASLVTSEGDQPLANDIVATLFGLLRPYGGTMVLETEESQHAELRAAVATNKLPNAELKRGSAVSLLARVGALPGAADWTHEYGDPSNTLMSRDDLVKSPLGVLWFGGPAGSGDLFYNRHFWGPSMAVIGGRMFIQGPGKLTAIDIYTGRILWQTPLKQPENYNPGRRGNNFENKLMGFHFLAVDDSLYLVQGKDCLRLDPVTGEEIGRFQLPQPDDEWGRIRVQDDILLATAFRDTEHGKLAKQLVAMNRLTGDVMWTREANLTFPFVAAGGGRVFCFDGALENLYRDWSRKGLVPKAGDIRTLKAFDLKTGKPVWESSTNMIVTWLSYSAKHDILIASNKEGVAGHNGKSGRELWQKTGEGRGFRGHPESYWDKVILWNDRVIDQRGPGLAYDIRTGKPSQRKHPITGQNIDWEFTKSGHHCNYAIANPHMLTFRAASAGFCDIDSGNTSRLSGYRSGCRNSLIPAGGLLNSPNMAHGCVCGYSLFTSLALRHVPENEAWSYNALTLDRGPVERLGVNFGAPGDRTSPDGVLWLDYPNVGGSSPAVAVKVTSEKPRYFQRHSAFLSGSDLRWVAASGLEGVRSVTIPLSNPKPRDYIVRLHFAEPDARARERVFDIAIEGKTQLEAFDLQQESAERGQAVVKELTVRADGELTVTFTPRVGETLVCGIEVVARP